MTAVSDSAVSGAALSQFLAFSSSGHCDPAGSLKPLQGVRHWESLSGLFRIPCQTAWGPCVGGTVKRSPKKQHLHFSLVHRITAFAFAFAMAIPRCRWRHRCVVTLGKFLVVLYSQPLWRKEKWKQRRKGDVRDVKNYHGRC